MNKSALTTTVGILLILYALANFGSAFGQFAKGKTVSGTTSIAASLGDFSGDQIGAQKVRRIGASSSGILYAIAIFILITAVLDMVAAIGLFSGSNWAFTFVVITAICGILVEIQDVAEDGFGIGKLIFLTVNAIALFTAFSARKIEPAIE